MVKGIGQIGPHPPASSRDGVRPVEPQTISDITVHETGEDTLEGDIGSVLERLVENQSLVKFWEGLWIHGVGTNNVEYMAENFEIEKLSKEGAILQEKRDSKVELS